MTTYLKDADWAEMNGLRAIYEQKGEKALSEALAKLTEQDPVRAAHVIGAFFPDELREAIRDAMAERGMTEEDLRELGAKLDGPAKH